MTTKTIKTLERLVGSRLRATLSKVRVKQAKYCGRSINPTTTIIMLEVDGKEVPQYFSTQQEAHKQFLAEDRWAMQKAVGAVAAMAAA